MIKSIKVSKEGKICIELNEGDDLCLQSLQELQDSDIYDSITHKQYSSIQRDIEDIKKLHFIGVQENVAKEVMKAVKGLDNLILYAEGDTCIAASMVMEGKEVVPLVLSSQCYPSLTQLINLTNKMNSQLQYHEKRGELVKFVPPSSFFDNRSKTVNLMSAAYISNAQTIPDNREVIKVSGINKKTEVLTRKSLLS